MSVKSTMIWRRLRSFSGRIRKLTECFLCLAGLLLFLSVMRNGKMRRVASNGHHPSSSLRSHPVQPSTGPRESPKITWKPVSSMPHAGFQEGSGKLIRYTAKEPERGEPLRREEIWFAGGFPADKGRIHVYDVLRKSWARRQVPDLPWGLHHVFNGMFFNSERQEIVILGGIIFQNNVHAPNNAALVISLDDGDKHLQEQTWRIVDLPVGGIIQCTTLDVDGVHWCYSGSSEFVEAPYRFFQFDPRTLSIVQWLPLPRLNTTHASLLLDEKRQLIHFFVGRTPDEHAANKVLYFDLRTSTWLPDEVDVPFVPLESRTAIQVRGKDVALLMGGQSNGGRIMFTSDVVIQYNLATREFRWVGEMPNSMYAPAVVPFAGGTRYFVYGGGSGPGPKFLRLAWEVDFSDYLFDAQHGSQLTGERLRVVKASCGSVVVTAALQQVLDDIRSGSSDSNGTVTAAPTDTTNHNKAVLSIPARWCGTRDAGGPGAPELPEVLTIHFLRDGLPHEVACEAHNSCLLSPVRVVSDESTKREVRSESES